MKTCLRLEFLSKTQWTLKQNILAHRKTRQIKDKHLNRGDVTNYQTGQKVLVLRREKTKTSARWENEYTVVSQHGIQVKIISFNGNIYYRNITRIKNVRSMDSKK